MANLPRAIRRGQIMREALIIANREGVEALTCRRVAKACKCAYRTVSRQYVNRRVLLEALVRYAETLGDEKFVASAKLLLDEKD
jgi:AcrR family transcriptional regulator